MLTEEENRLLTEVGPGRPMGELLRRYWTPALLSEELPEPDGAPVDVRLLGEDLVAFRDTSGSVGLLQRHCPHRGSALTYGRNEQGGLRCIYHGWKFGVDGRCLDLPTEPEGSPFKEKLRARAYPTREVAGIVWTYMGPPEHEPDFPSFVWTGLPAEQVAVWKIFQECNYLQMVERDVDSAHISVLHRRLGEDEIRATLGDDRLDPSSGIAEMDRRDTCPQIEVEETAYGFRYAAIRANGDGSSTARVYPFVHPWHPFIPAFPSGYHVCHAFVARDDTTSWHYLVCYNPDGPIDVGHYERTRGLELEGYRKRANLSSRFFQDREAMRAESFSGISGVIIQDHAIVEIQGPVADRTQENLTSTDAAIVALRRQLFDGIEAVQNDEPPPGIVPGIPYERIAGANVRLEPGESWQDACPLDDAFRAI